MYCYADFLFGVRTHVSQDAEGSISAFLDSDDPIVRNMPPYLLIPKAFCLVYSDDKGQVFPTYYATNSSETAEVMKRFDAALTAVANVPGIGSYELVGWNLDRVVLSALCANAAMYNVRLPQRFFRQTGDKWAKTNAHSVDRIFWQGWFSVDKESESKDAMNLTLTDAARLCNMDTPEVVAQAMNDGGNGDPNELRLASRLAVVSNLFTRYQELLAPRR